VAIIARAIGAGNRDEASTAAGQSLMLALVVGLVSGLAGWAVSDALLRLLGAAPVVVADGGAYLRISLLGSFTAFVLFIANAALQGAGDAVTPMLVMALANLLNLALDPLLIFGWGPVPRLGVQGAALATVLSQATAALLSTHVLLRGKSSLQVRLAQCRPHFGMAWRILRIGIPGTGQMLSRSLMGVVMMRIVASCGTAAVAAYGTGMRLHIMILMPAFAMGGAVATLVGQNLGAGKPDRARHSAWLATWLNMAFMVLAALGLALFAPQTIRFFNSDPEVVQIGARYLQIVSPFYVFASLGIVLGRGLNGAGDTVMPMLSTVFSLWVLQVPLAVWLARVWQPATHGIWWAMVVGTVVHGVLIAGWFETGRWKHKRV
jgi:putative MATE family efflux protein